MATESSPRRAFRGVTYSQFDNHLGPKLLFSYPADAISNEVFESLSDYAIVGKHFCDKTITVKLGDIQFLNYSVAIENAKYVRNTIMFSFGMVLDVNVDSEPYEAILRKVSETFQTLEVRSCYISLILMFYLLLLLITLYHHIFLCIFVVGVRISVSK